ncbi:ABC transporter ATP-binding protein [Chthonobacter rhizosphaerae]|uniref:energy-coupling factor ABC transporter ATP-binding protein n=1 Tax=Chthonobacter rhizosphaerae TaxID=2735553 RepID=UPI0015EE3BA0
MHPNAPVLLDDGRPAGPRVRFDGVAVDLGGASVLRDIDLDLAERRIGVLGLNGSGKSTLGRLVNGLVAPTRGRVTVDGLDTVADGRAVRRKVGFVFQAPENQIVLPIVGEDVALGLKTLGASRKDAAAGARRALERFGLGDLVDRSSHSLSGGQRQLVALAAVLVMEPALVVFDEPTTQLDLRNRNAVARAIDAMDAAALVITHDLDLVAGYDRCLVLEAGRVAFDGAPAEAVRFYRERAA